MQGQKESGFNVSSAYVLKSDMESSSPVDAGSNYCRVITLSIIPFTDQYPPFTPHMIRDSRIAEK